MCYLACYTVKIQFVGFFSATYHCSQFTVLSIACAILFVCSVELGCAEEILTIVAMLSVENPFYRPKEKQAQADMKKAKFFQPEVGCRVGVTDWLAPLPPDFDWPFVVWLFLLVVMMVMGVVVVVMMVVMMVMLVMINVMIRCDNDDEDDHGVDHDGDGID